MRRAARRRIGASHPWAQFAIGVLVLFATSCAPEAPSSPVRPEGASGVAELPSSRTDPRPRHAAIHRGESMLAANTACEGCHRDVAEEWRDSLHHESWNEPAFQRAFAREPLSFCQSCHVPEANPNAPPSPALGDLGTGCVTCHLVEEGILATRRNEHRALRAEPSPHAVVRDGRLEGDAACARCHEFSFPHGGSPAGPRVPMQSTVTEHQRSPASSQSCASCHMPSGEHDARRRSHRFASSRDEARLRAAISVVAARRSATSAELHIQSNVGGHAFPTGDLFRRIEVLVEAVGPGEVLVARDVRYLARHFPLTAATPGGVRHRTVGPDDRLEASPRTLSFDLGAAAAGHSLRYRVAYQRVAHPVPGKEGAAELDGEVVLVEGELPP